MGVARGDGVPVRSNGDRIAALELVTMAVVPGAALALARLNVFEALAQAGDGAHLTAAELAARAVPGRSIDVANLERLLRMVSGVNVLREGEVDGERSYALAPVGRFLVEDAEHGSFLDVLKLQQSSQYLQALDHLHESVLDASITPHVRAHGMPAWESSSCTRSVTRS
jgi:caffeic acid 3-O-methyltransferase